MERAEMKDKGLMAVNLGHRILRFANTRYDGKYRCWTPDSVLYLADYLTFFTKAKAIAYSNSIGFAAHHVERLGNRFGLAWGIRHDVRDTYFLFEVVDAQDAGCKTAQ